MGKYKYPPAIYKEIAIKYSQGFNGPQLGKEYGFSKKQIIQIVKNFGIKIRTLSECLRGKRGGKRLFNDNQERQICILYQQGLCQREIANLYRTYHTNIARVLKINHIQTRITKETGKIKEYTSRWNGGVSYDTKGHRRLYLPEYKNYCKGGIIAEHRYIMEQYLERKLSPSEIVHHINGIPDDNRLENLQIMTAGEHSRLHNSKVFY
jgi:hypothetical protein